METIDKVIRATTTATDAAAVLAEWQADEARVRARMASVGVARREQVAGMTGLQVFEAMFAGELPRPPIGDTMDFIAVSAGFGSAVFQGTPMLRHYNPLGSVHGGWIAALLDSCVGCAVHTTLPAGKGYTTAELKINYVRAVTIKTPLLRAEGKVIHVGNRMATADGRLVGPDGKLYAHATTPCFIFDAP